MSQSPFAGMGYVDGAPTATLQREVPMPGLRSPFAEALMETRDDNEQAYESLLNELQNETFDEAVEALVDEAAALDLVSPWNEQGPTHLNAWAARVTADTNHFLEHLEHTFQDRTLESITEEEIDRAAANFATAPFSPAVEQLFGGILKKLKSGVTSLAKKGLAVVAKFTGIAKLTGILGKLAEPLVKRVVNLVVNRLPASLKGPATELARKLTGKVATTAKDLAADFDQRAAGALTATNDAALDTALADADAAAAQGTESELDDARAKLADEFLSAPPNEPPTVQIEQFIPAVMAAMPLIKTAAKLIGQDRIRRLVAGPVATFVARFVGQEKAKALAPHIAAQGLKLLGLEYDDRPLVGAEALVTTIEETVRDVLTLPAEALADDLRVAAEVQEAFAEAAARNLPANLLRTDLESADEEAEAGRWVLMPRKARPRYRYRTYSHPLVVRVSRPTARLIVFADGETLEDRLLDEGTTSWPTEAEIRVYETIPGTQLGHLAAESEETLSTYEFGELTPTTAGLLLNNPRLGRLPGPGGVGRRLFRLAGPWHRPRRRRRRIGLRLVLDAAQPVLRVHLRIGERAAHAIAGQLEQNAHAQVVATVRQLLGPNARKSLAERLARPTALRQSTPDQRKAMADAVAEAMLAALAKELPQAGATLAQAAKDPASGITITFAVPFADQAALQAATPGTPTVTIRPGHHSD
ncbi:hypothetical protein [Tenggerimyces flavus]|uniref:Uncharacterized protein n=1 Tax=Tenggerimyces flavus TaxID=1708749 RepID=A0ABV7YNI2_9ACTN|nr:hypothetical protein [Tenggerimyces flavus]MBM7784421.1 hypothetical protein [Tenggerimyces flavus]